MSINVYDCHINTYCITHYESKCIKLLLKALQWLLNSLWVKINVLRRTSIPSLGRPLWSLHHSLLIHVVLATLIPLILLVFQGLLLVLFTTCQALPAPHIHMNDFLTSCRSLLRGHLLNKAFARPLNKHFNAPNSSYNLFLPDVFFSYLPISNVICLKYIHIYIYIQKYIKTMRVGFSFSVLFNARSLRTRTLPKFNE